MSRRLGDGASRDPDGHMVEEGGVLLRRVASRFHGAYRSFMDGGLYDALRRERLLVPHQERDGAPEAGGRNGLVLLPERVPFVSHPSEWCFGQLREAALTTLRAQRIALRFGFTMKDAPAGNVQFHAGRMTLIDTLSFRPREGDEPWAGYGQFVRHFLAPLAMTAYGHPDTILALRAFPDGLPLDYTAAMLPTRARWRPALATHVRLQARLARRANGISGAPPRMSARAVEGVLDHLERLLERLRWEPLETEWTRYPHSAQSAADVVGPKGAAVDSLLRPAPGETVWDFGTNDGTYARRAALRGAFAVGFDSDPSVVELAWRAVRESGERSFLPLRMDVTNPTPAHGWAQEERRGFIERGPCDALIAFAVLHHMTLGHGVPLDAAASFFARCARRALVEWIPAEDPKVQSMVQARRGVVHEYSRQTYLDSFSAHFVHGGTAPVADTGRVVDLWERRTP